VLELGASHHVTGNSQVLLDAQPCTDVSVTFGNGHRHKATFIGDVITLHFGHQLQLHGVLYVPGASEPLLHPQRDKMRCVLRVQHILLRNYAAQQPPYRRCVLRDGRHIQHYRQQCVLNTLRSVSVSSVLWPQRSCLLHRRFNHLGHDNMARLAEEDTHGGGHECPCRGR